MIIKNTIDAIRFLFILTDDITQRITKSYKDLIKFPLQSSNNFIYIQKKSFRFEKPVL